MSRELAQNSRPLGMAEGDPESKGEITRLLISWRQGDQGAADQLFSVLYQELRRLARVHMQGERRDHRPRHRHHLSGGDRSQRLDNLASVCDEGQEGRDHLHGEDRHDTQTGQAPLVD